MTVPLIVLISNAPDFPATFIQTAHTEADM